MLLKEWVDINKNHLAVMKNCRDIRCVSAVGCTIDVNTITEAYLYSDIPMNTEVFYTNRIYLKKPIKGVKITFEAKMPKKRKPQSFVYYMGLEAVPDDRPGQA